MVLEQAAAFYLFALVASITPGPSNLILTSTGARVGIWRGLRALAGVALGMGLMMSLMAFGLGSLVLGHPLFVHILKWLGTAFLLWLAWKIATAPPGRAEAGQHFVGFWGAAAFQWINPKAWLITTGAVGAYLNPQAGGAGVQALYLGLLFMLAATPSCFCWLAFGAGMQRLLVRPRAARLLNLGMGLAMAASVALLW